MVFFEYSFQERPQSDRTNDVDASGGVDGEVIINTPDVDLTKGLVEVQIILTAYRTNSSGDRITNASINCGLN